MTKDLWVLVRIPEDDIDGEPSEVIDMVVGHGVRVQVEGLQFDGRIVQASVGESSEAHMITFTGPDERGWYLWTCSCGEYMEEASTQDVQQADAAYHLELVVKS